MTEPMEKQILLLADEKLSEMCKELCHHVTVELQKATRSLVNQVELKLQGSAEPELAGVKKDPNEKKPVAWLEVEEAETVGFDAFEGEFESPLGENFVHPKTPKFEEVEEVQEISPKPPKQPPTAWATRVSPEKDEAEVAEAAEFMGKTKFRSAVGTKRQKTTLIERVFGLVPDMNESKVDKMSKRRRQVQKWISSNCFEGFGMAMIILFSLQVGFQINYLAETSALDAGPVYRTIDGVFITWFTVEVGLKLYAYRLRFFTMHGCAWNILDFILNCVQMFEEIVHYASVFGAAPASSSQAVLNSGVMRTVRILRGIKVMRLVRTIRFAEELQLIVSCLILSVRTFLCILSLLLMAIYVMAIYATQAVYVYRLENPENQDKELLRWWGNIPTSMLSVFQALSGGLLGLKTITCSIKPAKSFFTFLQLHSDITRKLEKLAGVPHALASLCIWWEMGV